MKWGATCIFYILLWLRRSLWSFYEWGFKEISMILCTYIYMNKFCLYMHSYFLRIFVGLTYLSRCTCVNNLTLVWLSWKWSKWKHSAIEKRKVQVQLQWSVYAHYIIPTNFFNSDRPFKVGMPILHGWRNGIKTIIYFIKVPLLAMILK